ncbi:hypothetical protein [Gemella morbillorum]
MDKQQVIQEAKMKERKKQDKKNSKLDAKLEKFYLDDINQETKESLRYATSLFASGGDGLSDLFLPTKHVDTRNNELLRAITTQNYIIIKQNDNVEKQNARIIELLAEISSKLDK